MKKFLVRVFAWALLPVGLYTLLCAGVLYRTGELSAPEDLVRRTLAGEDLLIEMNFWGVDFTAWYKTEVAHQRAAEVLTAGNSRTMQLRQCMLPGADYYNAGGTVSKLELYLPFLRSFPEGTLPSVLILNLDSYYFIDAWYDPNPPEGWDYPYTRPDPADAIATVARRYGSGSFTLRQIWAADPRCVGLPACARGSGFSADGSYHYGSQAADGAVDLTFQDALNRIRKGSSRFEHADALCEGTLAQLDELLTFCDEQGITVVAFLPPYAPTVYAAMAENGGYGYLEQVWPAVSGVFAAHPGQEVYDFTWMPDTTDEMYLDGFHGGDVVYAMLLREMAQAGVLGEYTDEAALDALIAGAKNPRVIEPEG